jgi:hypothetical protein
MINVYDDQLFLKHETGKYPECKTAEDGEGGSTEIPPRIAPLLPSGVRGR